MHSVGDIKKLTGISARTLQYYDGISLLKPSALTDSGYRLYDDTALEKLQQILFFKELGFQLAEIKQIMDTPGFDKIQAYKTQKELLLLKRNRTDRLIKLLERLENGEPCMSFKEFDLSEYIGALEDFKNSNEPAIIRYWGSMENFDSFVDKVRQNEDEVARLAIKQFGSVEKYTEAMKENMSNFSEIMESKITDEAEETGHKRDALLGKLTQDLSADYRSDQIQNLVEQYIALVSGTGGPDLLSGADQTLIDSYSSEYIRKMTDRQFGNGATDYILKALHYYKER